MGVPSFYIFVGAVSWGMRVIISCSSLFYQEQFSLATKSLYMNDRMLVLCCGPHSSFPDACCERPQVVAILGLSAADAMPCGSSITALIWIDVQVRNLLAGLSPA